MPHPWLVHHDGSHSTQRREELLGRAITVTDEVYDVGSVETTCPGVRTAVIIANHAPTTGR